VTWCGSCSRPAGTPGWRSRTGSGSTSAPTARSRTRSGPTPGSWRPETLAVGLEVRPAAEVGGDPHPVALSTTGPTTGPTTGAVVTVALARVPS